MKSYNKYYIRKIFKRKVVLNRNNFWNDIIIY